MSGFEFPLPEYLKRIGLPEVPSPDEQGLRTVHSAQAFSIPFENFDIHLGRTISLEPSALVKKMLNQPRGGYCHELNGLLRLALKSLGFAVRTVMARVLYERTDLGARTHQVVIVTLSGQDWLADVGFGGPCLRLPLPIITDQVYEQYGDHYRLRHDARYGIILQKESQNAFIDLYAFNDKELTLDVDIEMSNHYTSTWPGSIFRLRRMCSLPQKWGRTTLTGMRLAIHRDGASAVQTLPPGPEYMKALSEHFGIVLDATSDDRAKPLAV
jgi:N-hydroxyarylamine O-acetyltransferase